MVRRFNEDEEVWRRFEQKRLERLLLGPRWPLAEEELDRLDWLEAESEVRQTRCIGSEEP